jgi:hypothetical protein
MAWVVLSMVQTAGLAAAVRQVLLMELEGRELLGKVLMEDQAGLQPPEPEAEEVAVGPQEEMQL